MPFDATQDSYVTFRNVVSGRTHPIVAWCGAGASSPARIPGWQRLRSLLQEALLKKSETLNIPDKQRLLGTARSIAAIPSHWSAFQALNRELGEATYSSIIRQALEPATTATLPIIYRHLWQLPISGLLNLNLDRLATRAHGTLLAPGNVTEFNSRSVGRYTHVLKSPEPYIYNIHGDIGDRSSWVFTQDELRSLYETPAYINFVRSILSTSTVVFVGISADDIAAGGHLDQLSRQGIDTGIHYWITNRDDISTDRWAEAAGVRVIRYKGTGGNHLELQELFDDLLSFVPPEDPTAPPVILSISRPQSANLPAAADLAREDEEAIRQQLNQVAVAILSDESPESFAKYSRFLEEYDIAVHRAWYTTTTPPRNILLGFTLDKEVARGAFGQVFHATRPNGEQVAIKLLLNQIRNDPALLKSFRRGVKSMRILHDNDVAGMVPYHEASEIPAFVVMDWIDGANLGDAVKAGQLNDWHSRLRVVVELSDIIRRAHALPARVLHRDLRPANVMLKGLWEGDWHVVVLDFDLSWHRGAFEHSVAHGTGVAGYWAPEQIERRPGVSTRHGAVDSFGLGMTLYYMLSGLDPVPEQHKHADWTDVLARIAARSPCKSWRSLPSRFARLIANATQDSQASRWDMSQIWGEASRLLEALLSPESVESTDMLAEEIAERSEAFGAYRWEQKGKSAFGQTSAGRTIELMGYDGSRRIELSVGWRDIGVHEWKRVAKWAAPAVHSGADLLKAAGWSIDSATSSGQSASLHASIPLERARMDLDGTARTIDRVASLLSFD